MARRKSQRTHRSSESDILDDLDNESRSTLGRPAPPVRVVALKPDRDSDRRFWAPDPVSRDVTGRQARIVHKVTAPKTVHRAGGKLLQSGYRVNRWLENAQASYAEPRKAFICLRRKARREILFALKRTGKGARSPKRRNQWSDVSCSHR